MHDNDNDDDDDDDDDGNLDGSDKDDYNNEDVGVVIISFVDMTLQYCQSIFKITNIVTVMMIMMWLTVITMTIWVIMMIANWTIAITMMRDDDVGDSDEDDGSDFDNVNVVDDDDNLNVSDNDDAEGYSDNDGGDCDDGH